MKDYARRFRLRALMADGLKQGPKSIGDLARYVSDLLEADESLSRGLVPEVWLVARKEGGGGRHEQERLKFLRIQVLREVALSARQSIGLEPWGRMKVGYAGLEATLPWIQNQAHQLGMPPEGFRGGVAGLLDYLRKKRILHDPENEIFTKYWEDGDYEMQAGYLPPLGNPVGTKLRREPTEKTTLITQWISESGDTTIRQVARKWRVPAARKRVQPPVAFSLQPCNKSFVPTSSASRSILLYGFYKRAVLNLAQVFPPGSQGFGDGRVSGQQGLALAGPVQVVAFLGAFHEGFRKFPWRRRSKSTASFSWPSSPRASVTQTGNSSLMRAMLDWVRSGSAG